MQKGGGRPFTTTPSANYADNMQDFIRYYESRSLEGGLLNQKNNFVKMSGNAVTLHTNTHTNTHTYRTGRLSQSLPAGGVDLA